MNRKLQVFLPIAATAFAVWLASWTLSGCSPKPPTSPEPEDGSGG